MVVVAACKVQLRAKFVAAVRGNESNVITSYLRGIIAILREEREEEGKRWNS
jgi:hypothetical protein